MASPGRRKSIGPISGRPGVDPQGLQQLVTDSPWINEAMWRPSVKEALGAMWEQIPRLTQPRQERSTGLCAACGTKFKRIRNDSLAQE
jgi:hypothetical protein